MITLPAIYIDGIKCLDANQLPDDVAQIVLNGDTWTVYQAGDEIPSQGGGGE